MSRVPASSSNRRLRSVAATTASRSTLGPTCAFPGLINVVQIGTGNRRAIETHDGIRKVISFVRTHPGLDGLNHLTLPLIGRKRLGFDFLKLHWGPDFEHDIRADRTRALADTIGDIGPARLILYKCASARAIDCGRSMGITLFQGGYVDSMMRGAGPRNRSGGT